jgi:Flp pilus assembly protein CpaB
MTLALTPEQGQLLSLAAQGSITLSLRAFGDEDTQDLEPAISMMQVVVAAEQILAGQQITESMVEMKTVLATAVIQNAATSMKQVVGQISRYSVTQGDQLDINAAELASVQALSFQIPQGLRAFTMPVEVSTSPAALIVPGDYVDVLVALDIINFDQASLFQDEEAAADEDWKGTVTLFQNLRVLAVQQDYVDHGVPYDASVRGAPTQNSGASNMTLAVTPKQAQLLWLAAAKDGLMTVTLRPYGDDQTEPLSPILEPIQWSAIPIEGLP